MMKIIVRIMYGILVLLTGFVVFSDASFQRTQNFYFDSATKNLENNLPEFVHDTMLITGSNRFLKEPIYRLRSEDNEFSFKTSVSKGTYIRSLAVDIASKLNTFGALKALKRTKIDNYLLSDAVDLENLSINDIKSIEDIFKDLDSIVLNDYMINLVKNGIYLDERQMITNNDFKVYNENKELVAIYEVVSENKYRPFILL